jgi:hypothetical protein
MKRNLNVSNMDPTDSNIYSNINRGKHTTPLGSHITGSNGLYKYLIPLGLLKQIKETQFEC